MNVTNDPKTFVNCDLEPGPAVEISTAALSARLTAIERELGPSRATVRSERMDAACMPTPAGSLLEHAAGQAGRLDERAEQLLVRVDDIITRLVGPDQRVSAQVCVPEQPRDTGQAVAHLLNDRLQRLEELLMQLGEGMSVLEGL